MKYYVEENLSNFKFWSGGADRAKQLTSRELDELDDLLPELLGDDCSDTAINDLFWFDFDKVVELIGLRLNSSGDIIRGIDDVDGDVVTGAVSDWADDNGYELDEDQMQALADAIREADGLGLDDDCSITVEDDVATECAERLGYSNEDEDED